MISSQFPSQSQFHSTSKPSSSSRKRLCHEEDEIAHEKTKKPKPSMKDSKKIKKLKPSMEDLKNIKNPELSTEDRREVKNLELLLRTSTNKSISWNPKDEVSFLKAVVAYCQDRKEIPKKLMTPVYEYVLSLNVLDHDYNIKHLRNKFRSLRTKFVDMQNKVKGTDNRFKTAHEEILYKLCRKIWRPKEDEGNDDEESEKREEYAVKEAKVGYGAKEGRAAKKVGQKDAGEEENKSRMEDVQMTQQETDKIEEEGEDEDGTHIKQNLGLRKHVAVKGAKATQHVVSNDSISNGVKDNTYGKLIDQIRMENSVLMNAIKGQLRRECQEFKSGIVKMLRDGLHSCVKEGARNHIGFLSKEVVNNTYSGRELPALDESEAKILEQKWVRQEIAELEICSGHLALLLEECQKRMEKFRRY